MYYKIFFSVTSSSLKTFLIPTYTFITSSRISRTFNIIGEIVVSLAIHSFIESKRQKLKSPPAHTSVTLSKILIVETNNRDSRNANQDMNLCEVVSPSKRSPENPIMAAMMLLVVEVNFNFRIIGLASGRMNMT